jgi:hypothetical protein
MIYLGFAHRGLASTRFNVMGMALTYPPFLYLGYTLPIHRKYYTDLIADNGDDGDYIRNCLAYHKPGLWKKISRQLEHLGLEFKQNLISGTSIEFPSNFVSSKTIY